MFDSLDEEQRNKEHFETIEGIQKSRASVARKGETFVANVAVDPKDPDTNTLKQLQLQQEAVYGDKGKNVRLEPKVWFREGSSVVEISGTDKSGRTHYGVYLSDKEAGQ